MAGGRYSISVRRWFGASMILFMLTTGVIAQEQATGSIRGTVYDKDFEMSVKEAVVSVLGTDLSTRTSDLGNYLLKGVPVGTHTVVFKKDTYITQRKFEVLVKEDGLTEVNVWLSGDITPLPEHVAQVSAQLGGASEEGLLELRLESASVMDTVGAEFMSRAGASDAAAALKLVSGASVQDGKFAVIRGLPDRYVSSQLNGVRLPSADEDKRAVELDQFPSAVLESLRVSKTFTPEQQGDASGGAVDVRLKGIPDEWTFSVRSQVGFNSEVGSGNRFLGYKHGGINRWGRDDGRRDIQWDRLANNDSWTGAVGVSREQAPIDWKGTIATGGQHEFKSGLRVGGFVSFFYERDSSYFANGVDDAYWVERAGQAPVPRRNQIDGFDDYKTALFDVQQGRKSVQWGGVSTFGVETDDHGINVAFLYTRTAEDSATLAEDTRGKQFFFPGFDPNNMTTPGHLDEDAAPYLRSETLQYTERLTRSLQFHGRHKFELEGVATPEIDWLFARSLAGSDQPDKRLFGSQWRPFRSTRKPAQHRPLLPSANINFGNLQRIWKKIEEDSETVAFNIKFPFQSWSEEDEGYVKFGAFHDHVERDFNQETFSNPGDPGFFNGQFGERWSERFPYEQHPIQETEFDVDYKGDQVIAAWYGMFDLPITDAIKFIGGVRFESTNIDIVNDAERFASYFPPGSINPIALTPGAADVKYSENHWLPSLSLVLQPTETITLRFAYNETIARQTFKELTPIQQQEFLGGPVFVGNPNLTMSELKNYDARLDYRPAPGLLLSTSAFYKDIRGPIENVQRVGLFDFSTPVNYPKGRLSGFELEVRQDLGYLWDGFEGLGIGGNATFLNSEVVLPDDEAAGFLKPNIQAPLEKRDMTNTPEYLYNIYLTYDYERSGTQVALFWTVTGDRLIAGAGEARGNFVPNLYAKEFDTLNFSLNQRLTDHFRLSFQAKNLTNPQVKTIYRSKYIPRDLTKTANRGGVDLSLSLSANFKF